MIDKEKTLEKEMIALVSNDSVYTLEDMQKLFDDNRKKFPDYSRSFKKFLLRLLELSLTERQILEEGGNRKKPVFTVGEFDNFECVSKIKDSAYFSHHTALFLNDMHEYTSKAVYLSYELAERKSFKKPVLDQKSIDKAFSVPPREARRFTFDCKSVILHASKYNGGIGIVKNSGGKFYQTDPERTLIDSIVSPHLSGGIMNVLQILIHYKGRYSTQKIYDYLLALDYVYPYHQAIGFLLETAGYSRKELLMFENMGIEYKFYLDHEIMHPYLDEKWNIVHPEDIYC